MFWNQKVIMRRWRGGGVETDCLNLRCNEGEYFCYRWYNVGLSCKNVPNNKTIFRYLVYSQNVFGEEIIKEIHFCIHLNYVHFD